ncbi:MAG: hypothetical protein ACWGSQ_17390 [Longimicrobiales bacterium]
MNPKLDAAHRRLSAQVLGRPGVTGTAVGEEDGKPCLKVYLSDKKAAESLPGSVAGFRVVVEITGPFRRL